MAAIGLLGGTFDPVHHGHLRGALEAAESLNLDRVVFLPAAHSPLKATPGVDAEKRLAMLKLAIEGSTRLAVDDRELRRPGLSYTVETLTEVRAELSECDSLTFIMGADSLANLHRWHRWRDIISLANIAVLARPDAVKPTDADVMALIELCSTPPAELCKRPAGGVAFIEQAQLAISSTHIRGLFAQGASARFLLPDSVIEYITRLNLYTR